MTGNNDWQKNGQYNSGEKVEKRNKSGLNDKQLERYLKQHNENHKK